MRPAKELMGLMKNIKKQNALGLQVLALLLFTAPAWLPLPFAAHAVEASACAEVVMQINQELTLERQGFEATMKISNPLAGIDLTTVKISVNFTDKEGNPAVASSDPNNTTADFFITWDQPNTTGITDISGAGTVAGPGTAVIKWVIIPSLGAANQSPAGAVYYVGATLEFKLRGEDQKIEVAPDFDKWVHSI